MSAEPTALELPHICSLVLFTEASILYFQIGLVLKITCFSIDLYRVLIQGTGLFFFFFLNPGHVVFLDIKYVL